MISESSELSIYEQEYFTLTKFYSPTYKNTDNLSFSAQGCALSTALNMVHLPTEVASINEMGDELDSMDILPELNR